MADLAQLSVVALIATLFVILAVAALRKNQRGVTGTALRVIHEQFGSRDWFVALVAVVFLITFHWFAVETHHVLAATTWDEVKWWAVGLMPAIFLALVLLARLHQPQYTPEITQHPAGARRALVLLLSPPKQSDEELDKIEGSLLDPKLREGFTGPWRMPMEAVAHHAGQGVVSTKVLLGSGIRSDQPLYGVLQRGVLQTVVVMGSSDSGGLKNGTFRCLDKFKETVNRLLPAAVVSVETWRTPEFPNGVDFENAEELNRCVGSVLQWLLSERKPHTYREQEVMLDITGGGKVATVICAAQTLFTTQRKFQYVAYDAGNDKFEVKEYDVTFRPPEPGAHWN